MRCKNCYRWYTKEEVEEMLESMFGSLNWVDEDYRVLISCLCCLCWPEY